MFVLPCRNLSFCLRGTLTFGSSCWQNRFAALRCCARYFTWGLGDLVFNYICGKMMNLTEKVKEIIWQKSGKVKNWYGNVMDL
jgi:hypothetical protein